MDTPWLGIAKQWGLVAGRGIPTPEIFKALGLPTTNLHFTRTSDIKTWNNCAMEYRYAIMGARVPSGPKAAWKMVGNVFHKVFTEFAKDSDPCKTVDLVEGLCSDMTEEARLHPSPYQAKALEQASETLHQLSDFFGDPEVIPEKLGLAEVLAVEEPMWLWIPAWAIGVASGDLAAIDYATKVKQGQALGLPRPNYSGVFGVVLMFQVDVIGVEHSGAGVCLQIKTHSDDDLEVLCNELSFGLHELVYDIGVSLVGITEGWPPIVESTLVAVNKTPRKLDKIEMLKTISDAIETGKVEADGPDLYRKDCTDKQWERLIGMWERYQEKVRAAQQDYETWPKRTVQFLPLDQRFDRQPMLFATLLLQLGRALIAESRPDLIHLTPHNHGACRGMYNQPCVYRHAMYCGASDDLKGPEWEWAEVDYVNKAAANFREALSEAKTQ